MIDEEEQNWHEIVLGTLTEHGDVPVEKTTFEITVPPENDNGFAVQIQAGSESFTVYHDVWHEEFDNIQEALCCFLLGLTTAERLKLTFRGMYAYKWEAETNVEGEWGSMGVTGLFLFPFWRRAKTVYRQNDWINVDSLREWIPDRFTSCRIT